MSQVVEALRRVALDSSANLNGAPPRTIVEDRSILEQYASERPFVSRATMGAAPAEGAVISKTGLAALSRSLAGKVVVSDNTPPFSVEQYRRLAAALEDLQIERGVKTLMVSSAVPNEGKTLTITNLALTLSQSYKRRILLIDADLRRPSIQEVFGLNSGAGLCDDLQSGSGTLSTVDVSPNLSVLLAGRTHADPMAELSSVQMRALVQNAAGQFDWVLLDTPPVCVLPDAHLVARVADAILLVIAARMTPYQLVGRAIAELGADRIIGTVLNRAEEPASTVRDFYWRYFTPDT
jgi:capsular exopolysaccharide synthesis family protein